MNEHLQKILIETLEKAQAGVEKSVDFAAAQIPDVIDQLLKWELVYHGAWAILWSIMIAILFIISRKLWKLAEGVGEFDRPIARVWIAGLTLVFCSYILFTDVVPNSLTCFKIYFAPKVFLIEYCADLINHEKVKAGGGFTILRHNH